MRHKLNMFIVLGLLLVLPAGALQAAPVARPVAAPPVYGPFSSQPVYPTVFNGDLRDLPQLPESSEAPALLPLRLTPAEQAAAAWAAPLKAAGAEAPRVISAPMPPPIANFAGLNFSQNGAGWPPDTNGDVGPNHYIQTVNTSVGIYDKATGTRLVGVTFNTFFTGPLGSPCDTSNDGDPVALYDSMADRWIVTDFAWLNFNTGPYYECIAVSQTADPVAGGWYFYALQANTGVFTGDYFNDYPKLSVWPDAYYMTANMFEAVGSGFGVRFWALDRTSILAGGPLNEVHFDLCTDGSCGSFLPSNLRGTLPPAGAPNYLAEMSAPDKMNVYKFHVDWGTPANSTLTGPLAVPVTPFGIYNAGVPQQGTSQTLDSLSFRPMMQFQYRNMGSHESLWATHTINQGGIASARWYEVRLPGGTPTLMQEGTQILADGNHRWMASIAADKEGNAALGYSVSGPSLFPSIRYAGRLNGEFPGQLPQTETTLIAGGGSQTGIDRWGDYSTMTVDPVDDCTFWYTTEYYATSGTNWQTRIGSFKFPSCGAAKGTLNGRVYNTVTNGGVAGAPVTLASPGETLTVMTDGSGNYSADVLPGTYDITAGPLLPGYPTPVTVSGRVVVASGTTTTDIGLVPVPHLVYNSEMVNDTGPGGNGNGYPEPGETGVGLLVGLMNDGAATSTGISAVLSSSTPGVSVTSNSSTYPDIAAGASANNNTPYVISIAPTVACGTELMFNLAVTTNEGSYSLDFSINASVPQPPMSVFFDDFESGVNGWTTGGTNNTWAQTTSASQSPTHSWTDSPAGNYADNTNSWLQSPVLDLSGKTGVTVSSWAKFQLEAGFDFTYLEYSTDGGSTWNPTALSEYNGVQANFEQRMVDASVLNNQANVALRYHLISDAGVVADGFYVDDFDVSYQPIVCEPINPTAVGLADVSATTDAVPQGAVLAVLALAVAGGFIVLRRRHAA